MPVLRGRWCPSCGSAVGWHDEVCSNCGMPLDEEWAKPAHVTADASTQNVAGEGLVQGEVGESPEAQEAPRIESAIPAEDDPTSKVAALEVIPRTSRFLVAAVASIIFVCGIALVLTHPWNIDAYSIKATKEKDTSMAGFPGTVESLSGQDSVEGESVEILNEDDALYADLTEAYEKLGRYAGRADESERLFGEVAFGSDTDERTRGKREAEALAIDVSNVIASLGELGTTSTLYAEDIDHLMTLGNWLRNRTDALLAAWVADVESENPTEDREQIMSLLQNEDGKEGTNAYKKLFDESYEGWKPEHKVSEESEEQEE